ncbi:uncharacterized protein PHACADRAFT_252884 [Phanerochaete carnosa HHB-10118-sp]|uniref:F-box domain-containing protein n=1 Tax=Phanerochaete carnosa (strain HHB-10118-sp) TaxID=650164 RepID=K5WGQ5_PHACS|nr:uncharacterized protein PHACADRAFT_252884 [Phanerochaete carnosa HHB-10118-sp]EKM58505.1 hypothetical protein PHACADRAFT_252884 [Phanerochaete carnosa HHB-10118-sp]
MPTPAPIIQGSDHLSDVHHPDSFGLLGVDISGFEPGRYVRYHHVVKTTPAGLMDIVNVLPALQCLDLHGDPFDPALPSPPHHSVQASRDLDNLCLSGLQEDTGYEQLSQFLQCFQRIRVLALDDLSWNHLSTPGIHVSGPFPSVNTLKLDENALSAYWISAFASMLDLRSLFVLNIWDTAITWDGLRATHDLVSRCTSLTALTCSCFNTIVITQCPFPCSTLRLLHFRGECTFNGLLETTESPWRGIAEVMGSPLTISVNELVVDFTIVESTGRNRLPVSDKVAESRLKDTLASLGWRLLDDLLPRLRSLNSP